MGSSIVAASTVWTDPWLGDFNMAITTAEAVSETERASPTDMGRIDMPKLPNADPTQAYKKVPLEEPNQSQLDV